MHFQSSSSKNQEALLVFDITSTVAVTALSRIFLIISFISIEISTSLASHKDRILKEHCPTTCG